MATIKAVKVLIVASKLGYQTRVLAQAAERMGLEPMLATDRCGSMDDPWLDHAFPLKFYRPEESARRAEKSVRGVEGIIAVGDKPALAAAHIARRLKLPFHPVNAVEAAGNKDLSRRKLKRAGLPVPKFFSVALNTEPEEACGRARFPCVLKPIGLSGSRGVIRANTAEEFKAAFLRIKRLLELPELLRHRDPTLNFIQVEDYIEGQEFALDGVVTNGKLRTLAICDKPEPLDGPFFEETIYTTPSRHSMKTQKALQAAIQQAVDALGLTHGPLHAEARVNAAGVWVLEVAARPIGGLCARVMRFNGGIPLEEVLLRHSLGEKVPALKLDGPAAGVMMIPIPRDGIYQDCRGVEEAARVEHIEGVEITAKPGQTFRKLPEGGSYLGFLFARAEKPETVEASLRQAHGRLEFHFATTLPVLPQK
ncbi:MAG: ATP-grasp domain-containing protein [Acidobacteria bacterium]|nr:ATP-grasp domain-containing protein [Acidobacteriota bacterium]